MVPSQDLHSHKVKVAEDGSARVVVNTHLSLQSDGLLLDEEGNKDEEREFFLTHSLKEELEEMKDIDE